MKNLMWKIFILCSFIYANGALDLLGLSLGVPSIQAEHSIGVLTSTNTQPSTHQQLLQSRRPDVGSTSKRPISCTKSLTIINGGQPVCANTLIFEDHFNGPALNLSNWGEEQYIPQEPDYEFVTYEKNARNIYLNRGNLNIKPTPRQDPFIDKLDLTKGCTRKVCSLSSIGTILPPVVSAKIQSHFTFQYGKIEIRAQLPRGDWIYPQLYLEPRSYKYGNGYNSGLMWVAFARGNRDLKTGETGEQIGNKVLYSGPVLAASEPERTNFVTVSPAYQNFLWADAFHFFTLSWSPDGISVEVDGIEQGFINPPFSNINVPYAKQWKTNMAPFDQEFAITLGVGVGGHSDFPDACTSNGKKKPWKKTNSKATTLFNAVIDEWYPTWGGENAALKIDYVKVWSFYASDDYSPYSAEPVKPLQPAYSTGVRSSSNTKLTPNRPAYQYENVGDYTEPLYTKPTQQPAYSTGVRSSSNANLTPNRPAYSTGVSSSSNTNLTPNRPAYQYDYVKPVYTELPAQQPGYQAPPSHYVKPVYTERPAQQPAYQAPPSNYVKPVYYIKPFQLPVLQSKPDVDTTGPCMKSLTTINGGHSVCTNTLIFKEHFNEAALNLSRWLEEQYIPQEPDYEFVTYEKNAQNIFINRGRLHIKPTPRQDPFIESLGLTRGCTGKWCSLTSIGTILPPIVSAKIRSYFSFKYGKIEIRAQLPRGDWIYPQLNLEPRSYKYGKGYSSGLMWVAFARGNVDLKSGETEEEIGNRVLYGGPVLASSEPERTNFVTVSPAYKNLLWADTFHIFTLSWSPDGISVEVDDIQQGFINPPFSNINVTYAKEWKTNMAPFDEEFVISLGVGVGGHADFPDDCTNKGKNKPWKKTNSKATTLFNNVKDEWYPTWAGENAALKIDYVKVWSL